MQDILDSLENIRGLAYFSLPKGEDNSDLPTSLRSNATGALGEWRIPCTHVFQPPASELELAVLDDNLAVPDVLRGILRHANGAELFRLHYQPEDSNNYWVAVYEILGVSELLRVNQLMLEVFLANAESDQRYSGMSRLNYLAFCDVRDGNYLGICLDEPDQGRVFLIDHEYSFYPYATLETAKAYRTVAGSIGDWLEFLVRTNGGGGMVAELMPL